MIVFKSKSQTQSNLMEQDARRWHSHAMGYRENGADLVHCIPATCNQTFGVSTIELYLTYHHGAQI